MSTEQYKAIFDVVNKEAAERPFTKRGRDYMTGVQPGCVQQCKGSQDPNDCYSDCMEWAHVGWLMSQARAPNPQVTFWPPDLKLGDPYPDYIEKK